MLVALPQTEWAEFVRLAAQPKPSARMVATEWLLRRWKRRDIARRQLEYESWKQSRYGCFSCRSMAGFIGPEERCVKCGAVNASGY